MFRTNDNVNLFFQIISLALAITILVLGGAWAVWNWYFGRISDPYEANESVSLDDQTIREPDAVSPADLPADAPAAPVSSATPAPTPSSLTVLQNNITAWRENGSPVHDDNVINILLIGMDLDSPDMTKNSRADAMMIASIDKANGRITLASIMRDQYCFMPKTGRFEKLHHANAYGGPAAQIALIEQYYKVSIDNYALVNFYSLPKIIDALGGLTVTITPQEAEFLNHNCGFHVEPGENHLPGQEILVYMRIRRGNTGGDEGRVMRQQQVFKQILARLRSVEKTALPGLVDELIPYMRTGYTPAAILALALEGVSDGWLHYDVAQIRLPDRDCAAEATIDGVWYWKVDFPLAARKLQTALFGRSNVVLEDGRKSWLAP